MHDHPDSVTPFRPVQAGRAFDDISAQIRGAMASGALRPGVRLPAERTLAAQFNVARNTLREALRSLESSGVLLLRRGAHAGAYIRDSSGEGVATGLLDMYKVGGVTPGQLTDARILVETAIIRAACDHRTDIDLADMKANVARARLLHREGRTQERREANLDFHRLVARATHNPLLVSVMEGILDVMQAYVSTIGEYDATFLFASRTRFIALLGDRDTAGASEEMEASLRQLQKRYLARTS